MRYRVPDDLERDDEMWLKRFSTKTLIGVAIAGVVGVMFSRFFLAFFGLATYGYVLTVIAMIIVAAVMSIKIPENRTLTGGGLYLWEYIFRKWNHNREKILYVKRVESDEEILNAIPDDVVVEEDDADVE